MLVNLTDVQEQGESIPNGSYTVISEKAEVAETKKGGTMIKVQYKIKEGEHTGRMIFGNFNLTNSNPLAVQIGLGQLKSMMKAFGHANINQLSSTSELLGLKGIVTVKTKISDDYGPQTEVKSYKPLAKIDQNTDLSNPFE